MKKIITLNFYIIFSLCSYAQISDNSLPLLNIKTVDGDMPKYTVIQSPENCIGTSITDNKYVNGKMVVTLKGDTIYDSKEFKKKESGIKIKVRGNSTGAFLAQHPYKIKLTKEDDLLGRSEEFKHKEWLLLSMYTWNPKLNNQESNILNILGLTVSKIVGQEWVPDYQFVNVVINDQYQGMYYLMEPVSRGSKRVALDDDGFLIEYDTFWWNEEIYFKTEYQSDYFGYTYKYPDEDDVTDEIQYEMTSYMNIIEKIIYNGGNITDYIDVESFAKWILIHDILGTDDSAGCNKFLSRRNGQSLLCMSATWDYDSAFRSDGLSTLHTTDMFFFPYLFKNDTFSQTYYKLWHSIRPILLSEIKINFDDVWSKYNYSFDDNMKIHQTKFANEGMNSLRSQIDEIISKMTKRINTLDGLLSSTAIHAITRQNINNNIYNLKGQRIKDKKNIYIHNRRKYLNE